MAKATGIQFDGESVKIVELEGNSRKFKVKSFHEQAFPAVHTGAQPQDQPALPAAALPVQTKPSEGRFGEIFKTANISKEQVISAVDSSNAIVRTLTVPLTNTDQIRKAIKFEFENYIHNIPVEDLVIDIYRISQEKNSSRLMTFGIPKKTVASHIESLESADINPVYVEIDITALFNAFSFTRHYKENPSCVLLLLENKFAKIMVLSEGTMVAVRIVRFELSEANVSALCRQVESTVFSADGGASPSCVFVIAGKTLQSGLFERMTEVLGIPVKEFSLEPSAEFTENNGSEFNAPPSAMAVPFGLALKGLEYDTTGIDLRQEEYKYEKRFDMLKKAVALLLCLTLTLLGLVTVNLSAELKNILDREDVVKDEQLKLFAKAVPDRPITRENDVLAELIKFEDEIKMAVGGGDHPLPVSAMEYCDELFSRIEKAKLSYLVLKTLRVSNSQKQIIMTGEMQQGEIQAMTNAINASDKFKTSLPNYTMNAENKAVFTYTISLKQKEEPRK